MPTTILDGETYEEAKWRRFAEEALIDEKITQRIDKELLELAAKAAGYRINGSVSGGLWISTNSGRSWQEWNPLVDDCDALRLAVKLEFYKLEFGCGYTAVCLSNDEIVYEKHNNDPYAATRRAIVRAAAEIGKTL